MDIVEKFGRFPHRNEILERKSTKEEEEWVKWNNETKTYAFAIINVPSILVKVYTNITYKGLRPI